jgi:RimJ/RimL family protein N-acetyltransferase
MLWGVDSSLSVRAASEVDEERLLDWANDSATRSNAFNSSAIARADHAVWFSRRLSDPENCRIYVVEADGSPIGQARFERNGNGWLIDYSVAAPYRGRGLGRAVLGLGLAEIAKLAPRDFAVGHVKLENKASRRVFESFGFAPERLEHAVAYRLDLKDFA